MSPRSIDLVNSITTTDAPSTLQNRYEYDGSGLVIYAGYAPRGMATSEDGWTIFKYTYSNSQVTLKQTTLDAWDARAAASYS